MKQLYSLFLCLISLLSSLSASTVEEATRSRILFLLQTGNEADSLELYESHYQCIGKHDSELLQQIALLMIEKGYRSKNPETQLMALYGAGISASEKVLPILQEGLTNPLPQLQLISLNFLSRLQSDEADESLNRAMASNFLLIRLEAAFHLAQKKTRKAVGQIDSLMNKVDPVLHPIFPQLFALAGTTEAVKILRKLLNHSYEKVRVEAILCAAKTGRDDLLPVIRILATHHTPSQQEACAWALGILKDEASIPRLEVLACSTAPHVRLAALNALYHLGQKERKEALEKEARSGNVFAIGVLGDVDGSESTLFELIQNPNLQIKINASLALLERRDPRCLISLAEILLRDPRDLAFVEAPSLGGAFKAWKATPSARQNFKDNPMPHELSLHMRETVLSEALNLPESEFLQLARVIFETQQNDLIPTLVGLLESMQTPGAIHILKTYQQKAGAPLIRNYCNLALFNLKEEGPYAENLRQWIVKQEKIDMIEFRPFVPWELRDHLTSYQLTPQETSRLLVEAFQSMASCQDEQGINTLLHAIRHGNEKNKYALVGLLMHAVR